MSASAPKRLVVFGASGHGKVVADTASSQGWRVLGFADDDPAKANQALLGLPVVAIGRARAADYCREQDAAIVVAIGDNRTRARVFADFVAKGIELATVIHRTATVAGSASLGAGTVVFANVAVNADTRVGRNAILNTAASVDHDNRLGDHCHLSPGVHTGGTVTVGMGTHLGVSVSVRDGICIGEWSVVGVGAAVVKDIPANVVAFGVPARVRRPYGP